MATPDAGIKKVIIPATSLPPLAIIDNSLYYIVRYRAISEDKTRTSAWSPLYDLQARNIPDVVGTSPVNISISSTGSSANKIVSIAWNTPTTLKVQSYDVYVDWQDSNGSTLSNGFIYAGSVNATANNSFSLAALSGANKVIAQIQVATFPKIAATNAVVKTSTATSI